MIVLGIETSCDDTSLALYAPDRGMIANLTASQLMHEAYGGVVPEIASRQHMRALLPVYDALLAKAGLTGRDIDGIGVSNGPGLVGRSWWAWASPSRSPSASANPSWACTTSRRTSSRMNFPAKHCNVPPSC